MGLIVPSFAFSKFSSNHTGAPSTSSLGTAVSCGASNADGSVISLLSALSFEAQLLEVAINNNNATTVDSSTLLHIVIDPAGGTAWDTTNKLIANILAGFAQTIGTSISPRTYFFPVRIPSGATVGALGRNVTGSARSPRVAIKAYGGLSRPEIWPTCDEVISIGDTPASSKGTTITPGNGAFGSWTSIGSTTNKDLFGVVLGVQGVGGTLAGVSYFVEVGINSAAIGPALFVASTTAEAFNNMPAYPIYYNIPSGSQLQARAICSGAPDNIDVCLYGLG